MHCIVSRLGLFLHGFIFRGSCNLSSMQASESLNLSSSALSIAIALVTSKGVAVGNCMAAGGGVSKGGTAMAGSGEGYEEGAMGRRQSRWQRRVQLRRKRLVTGDDSGIDTGYALPRASWR
ncbi:hypothetical protein GW17_00038698 [Ensete ventricosum]|nr:hypothetical protein GW17_00038698 [Ensete ventricosum]RZR85082.1 hypothetical protein BHM03_00012020 [Ensete ventricosum]